jgi:O-antigen chain-terminating methyltransferase
MVNRTSTDDDLRRLEAEREAAHGLYNEALTALDRAVQSVPSSLEPPPAYAAQTLGALTGLGAIVPADPLAALGGWRKRLAGFVWRFLGPALQQQQAFNAALVEQMARRAAVNREAFERVDRALLALNRLHDCLVRYAQHITAYVDTKDREGNGLERQFADDRTESLAAAVSGVADDVAKRWESMVAREQRYEARVTEQAKAVDELRVAVGSLQQGAQALKRELERWLQPAAPAPAGGATPVAASVPALSPALASDVLESYKYVGFEDRFRGHTSDIRARLEGYVHYFEGASDVLDMGCGRGEFLDLLRERGIGASGIDVNHEMVEICRARGLHVIEGDAVAHIAALEDGSLGGLFAAQVVEHLDPDHLIRLIDAASTRLRPGVWMVLETVNVACWAAFFDSYVRDLTHVRPIHPDTLKHLLQTSGFVDVEIVYRSPFPGHQKLQPVALPSFGFRPSEEEASLLDLAEHFNANVERLNARLFTSLDYAAVGRRP